MIKRLSIIILLLGGISLFGVKVDPIPYQPGNTVHGPNYEIPSVKWKKEADQRIDKYRKADFGITVVDEHGQPMKGVSVHVELQRHAFFWGGVMGTEFLTSPNSEKLQTYFLKYFNSSGSGSGLKPKACPIEPCEGSSTTFLYRAAVAQMEWFKKHDIPVRGHALVWEGEKWLAKNMRTVYENSSLSAVEKGKEMLFLQLQHLEHALEKWDVFCWDVVNEPRVNQLVNDLLPETNSLVESFKLAEEVRDKLGRDTGLFYNENQIISFVKKVGSFEENRDLYKSHIQDLLDAGVSLDGIGFQYRFRRVVSPEEAYRRLCDFEEFNLPYQATEFEVKPMLATEHFSHAQKKQMMAEFLTVFFSHPNSTGLWCWSFMDTKNGTLPDALFSYKGEPRPEGEQWIKMMEEDFNTDETIRTSSSGRASVRGFKGTYKIIAGYGSKKKTFDVTLKDNTNLELVCD